MKGATEPVQENLVKGKGREIRLLLGHQRTNGPIVRDTNSGERPIPPEICNSSLS